MIDFALPDGIVATPTAHCGPLLDIETATCRACVSLHGGQVLAWQPTGHRPVLWLSEGARFEPGRAIRGGIPVCWPWFADHATDPEKPSHGFARIRGWQLRSASIIDGDAHVHLALTACSEDARLWPSASRPTLELRIGKSLSLRLSITNSDDRAIAFSQALHSYFSVSCITEVSIHGLQGRSYIDKLTAKPQVEQADALTFSGEVDRIYSHGADTVRLRDPQLQREIAVCQTGGSNIIVWNPWIEKTKRLDDMGSAAAYRDMVCIETGSVAAAAIALDRGETHELRTEISVTALQT